MNKVFLALTAIALIYQISSAASGDTLTVVGTVSLIQACGTTDGGAVPGEIVVVSGSYNFYIFPTDPGANLEYDMLLNAHLMTIRGYSIQVTFYYVKATNHLISCWY